MESIEHSISKLTEHFNARMADFQHALRESSTATSPSTGIGVQFEAFRQFVIMSLESLQLQVQVLSKQVDTMEMRSRRKMLLIHGVPELPKESVSSVVVKTLTNYFDLPDLLVTNLAYCKRLGQHMDGKPRPILTKFYDLSLRNKVWFLKSQLKGSGVTLSEYLTKERHRLFQTVRQTIGVSRCWTRNGHITVLGDDGKHHSVQTIADIKLISSQLNSVTVPPPVSSAVATPASASTPPVSICLSPSVSHVKTVTSQGDTGMTGQKNVRSCTTKAKSIKKQN